MLVNLPTHLVLEVNQCAMHGINFITLLSSNSIPWLWCMCMNFFEKVLIARSASMHAAWGTTKFLEPISLVLFLSYFFGCWEDVTADHSQTMQQLPGRLLCLLYWVSERKVSDPIKEEKKQYAWLHKTDSTTDLHASIPIKLSHYMNMHFSGHLLKMHTELLENIVFKDIEMLIQF